MVRKRSALSLIFATLLGTTSAQVPPTFVGCFSSIQPLRNQGYYKYQSSGHCNDVCQDENKAVLGLSKGNLCWCGNEIPSTNTKVRKSQCDTPCQGYNLEDCGGSNGTTQFFTVWVTNLRADVPVYQGGKSTSTTSQTTSKTSKTSSSGDSAAAGSQSTATNSKTSAKSSSSPYPASGSTGDGRHGTHMHGDEIVAIVLGVVFGVIALALIPFLFFWAQRRRKRREQADRPPSAMLSKPLSPQPEQTREELLAEKRQDSPTLPELNVQGPTPRMSTVTGASMRESSPPSMPNMLPLAAGATAGAAAGAATMPARKPVPTSSAPGPQAATEYSPTAERNASNSLALPGAGLRAADSFNSKASSTNDPFYTPLEYPSMTHLDQLDLQQLKDQSMHRDSTDGSRYSEDITALPIQRPDSEELPIQGRSPLGRSGAFLLPSSSEIRDFDFGDRARSS